MKDGIVLFVVCMLLVGLIGWWYVRDPFHPSPSANLIGPAAGEESKSPGPPKKPKNPNTQVKRQLSPETVAADPRPAFAAIPAVPLSVAAAPAPPFPAVDQISKGAAKVGIAETFGPPALSVTASNDGHVLETYVYARDRGQALTFIRFEDGIVLSAYSKSPRPLR